MRFLPKLNLLPSGLLLAGLCPFAGAASPAGPSAPLIQVGGERPSLPWTLRGEGLTLRVTAFNESAMTAAGTLQVVGKSSFPFTIDFEIDKDGMLDGTGRVQESKRSKRLTLREKSDGSVLVIYRAKRYVAAMVDGPAAGDAARPEANATTSGALRVSVHSFQDPKAGMASHTVLLPKGWKAKGGAYWFPEAYFQLMPSQEIKIESPEGLLVAIYPTFSAREYDSIPGSGQPKPPEGSNDAGTPIVYYPQDLEAWKRSIAKSLKEEYPNATKVRVKDAQLIEDLTAQVRSEIAPTKQSLLNDHALMTPMGMRSSLELDAYVIGFESYYTIGGRDYEEMRIAFITYHSMESEMTPRVTSWSHDRGFSFRAPVGTLEQNMPLLGTIAASFAATGPWSKMVAGIVAQRNGSNHAVAMNGLKESSKRANIIFAAGSAANDIRNKGYRDRSASQEGLQGQVVNAIQGVEAYTVPGSGASVQLPHGYSYVYTDSNGEYLLTNDALFQPGSDLTYDGKSWTAMQVSKR